MVDWNWYKYPEKVPANGQKIVYIQDSIQLTVAIFYDDEDEWTGEVFPRLDQGYALKENSVFYWIDYSELSSLLWGIK